jgi:hypothetical protein
MPQALSVINRGTGTIQFNATPEEGWFNLDQYTGSCPASVQVTPLTTDLEVGAHHGAIVFTASGHAPVRVELWLTIVDEGINQAPGAPVPISPRDDKEVSGLNVELTIENAVDPEGQSLTYLFEVYLEGSETMVAQIPVSEGQGTTTARLPDPLDPYTVYWWRAQAIDNYSARGPWSEPAHFVVGETTILGGCFCSANKPAGPSLILLLCLLLGLSFSARRRN